MPTRPIPSSLPRPITQIAPSSPAHGIRGQFGGLPPPPKVRITPPLNIDLPSRRPSCLKRRRYAKMSVFADNEVCLTCEKPLKSSDAFYCDAICRSKDGSSRPSKGASDSPSLLASLPALLASHVQHISGHQHRNHGASASSGSHSESSSPLQSPSPFGRPTTNLDSSPKEDFFHLPPPAYPNPAPHHFSSNPIRIASSYSQSPNPTAVSGTPASVHEIPSPFMEATLQYGRRPGQTNSVTSPLALLPVGARRRESNSNQHLNKRPHPRGLSPAPHGRVGGASENVNRAAPIGGEHRRPLVYGLHSPLMVPTSGRPSSTSAVDYAHANPARPTTITTSSSPGPESKPQPSAGPGPGSRVQSSADSLSSLIARRQSFPAHLLSGDRPKFGAVQKPKPVGSDADRYDSEAYDADVDVNSPSEVEDTSRRGRSRERRETSPSDSQAHAYTHAHTHDLSRSRGASREMFIGRRTDRSASRFDEDRRHRRSRSRSRSNELEREREHNRRRHHAKDLSTIVGSFQGSPLNLETSLPEVDSNSSNPPSPRLGRGGGRDRDLSREDDRTDATDAEKQLKRLFDQGVVA